MGKLRGWVGRAVAACVLGAALVPAVAPTRAAPAEVLGHAGRWITDAAGRVVVLHGVNKGAKNAPYDLVTGFTDADMAFLAANGFNAVRLGVEHDGLEPRPGVYDDAYVAEIASVVRRLVVHGLRPLIDFHQDEYGPAEGGNGIARWATIDDGLPHQPQCGFGCNQLVQPGMNQAWNHFWANDHLPGDRLGLQDHVARAAAHLATALRGVGGLLGYEFINEPWPGLAWPTCAVPLGCPLFDKGPLDAFNNRMAAAIRAADPAHLMFYEPQTIFNDGVSTFAGPLADPAHDSGFAFHVYCLLGGADMPAERPGGTELCPTLEQRTLDNAVAQVDRTGEALLMTEFGATVAPRPVRNITAGADQRMISWMWWEYTEAFRPNLGVLVRAYPRAVAGTPRGWSFDPDTKVFDLSFSTHPAGTRLTSDRTEIFVPTVQYPHGFALIVTGARVVAHRDQVLELATRPGARTVTVRITPRG